MDARTNENDMSKSSGERRRTEAALVRAIDMEPDADAPETHAAIRAYVDLLAKDGLLPEAVVIAFKSAVASSESLQQLETDVREATRSALVSACIRRYFTLHALDDVRVTRSPALRLVKNEREPPGAARAPDASA